MEDRDEQQEPRAFPRAQRARALRKSKYLPTVSLFIRLQWLWKYIDSKCQEHDRVLFLFRLRGSFVYRVQAIPSKSFGKYEDSLKFRA